MTTPPSRLSQVNPTKAAEVALAGLGLRASELPISPLRAVLAEAVRAALWFLWSEEQQSVGSRRFFQLATRISQPLFDGLDTLGTAADDRSGRTADDHVREVVEDLEIVGDLLRQPRGFWMPSPLRVVVLAVGEDCLLVGGCPLSSLPTNIRSGVKLDGARRRFTATPDQTTPRLPSEPWSIWARMPQTELGEWIDDQMDSASFSDAEGDWEGEVYAPDMSGRFVVQYDRWLPIARHAWNGVRAVRLRQRDRVTRHFWARFESGRLTQTADLNLGPGEIRRLMYGLDQRANNPTRVKYGLDRNAAIFVVRSALPSQETRLLLALGELQANADGRYYPLVWRIPTPHAEAARRAMSGLGIELVTK